MRPWNLRCYNPHSQETVLREAREKGTDHLEVTQQAGDGTDSCPDFLTPGRLALPLFLIAAVGSPQAASSLSR